nr:hypothetical protein [Tanacetum cinerariifolium]
MDCQGGNPCAPFCVSFASNSMKNLQLNVFSLDPRLHTLTNRSGVDEIQEGFENKHSENGVWAGEMVISFDSGIRRQGHVGCVGEMRECLYTVEVQGNSLGRWCYSKSWFWRVKLLYRRDVQADFAFFDLKPEDFHGVKVLMTTYLDNKEWALIIFVHLILEHTTSGAIIKIHGDEDNRVYDFIYAINLQRYKGAMMVVGTRKKLNNNILEEGGKHYMKQKEPGKSKEADEKMGDVCERKTTWTTKRTPRIIDPYGEIFSDSTVPKLQTAEDLQGGALLHNDAEIETKFLNSLQPEWLKYVTQVRLAKRLTVDTFDDLFDYLKQFEKVVNTSREKKLEKSHDPLALVAHRSSSSRNTSSYYVKHTTYVVDYDDEFQQDDIQTNPEDPLASAMLLLARAITQNFSNPTNNRLHTSSNTKTKQSFKVTGGKGHYARNCPKPRVWVSKYFMEQMLLEKQDEAEVILTDKQNDFLFADASRLEEIEELSANICLMARIQPTNITFDAGPSYDSAFINFEDKLKKNVDLIMLGPKPLFVYDQHLKHGLRYQNPYTLKKASSQCPKLYLAPSLGNSEIPLNVRDTEVTLDDASKSQQKVKEKMSDPIAVSNKQNCWTIDYKQINALYKDFVP